MAIVAFHVYNQPMSATEAEVEISFQKADVWVRHVTFILDWIVLGVLSFLINNFFLYVSDELAPIADLLSLLIIVGYFTYFFGKGQTPGMKVLYVKLCGTDGKYPIGYSKGFVRFIGMCISGLVWGLGFFWILIDKNNQGWHDKIADTYVVTGDYTEKKIRKPVPIKKEHVFMKFLIFIIICDISWLAIFFSQAPYEFLMILIFFVPLIIWVKLKVDLIKKKPRDENILGYPSFIPLIAFIFLTIILSTGANGVIAAIWFFIWILSNVSLFDFSTNFKLNISMKILAFLVLIFNPMLIGILGGLSGSYW
jgi:uncharacterized RDD family membrane protein YckC